MAASDKQDDKTGPSQDDLVHQEVVNAEKNEEVSGELFQLTVNLPHEPFKLPLLVSLQEAVQDLRQSIVETPGTFRYSCFHLEHDGQRINDFIQISEIAGLQPGSELRLVEDPYTEKEARVHIIRVRELIGAAADRVDTAHGILAGTSLHDELQDHLQSENGTEVPSNPLVDYDFQRSGDLAVLLPQGRESLPKTLKSLAVSPWNPPPYHLRQRGHLLYLQILTNEGEQYHITSHVTGFYVNKCSNSKFDPSPRAAPKNQAAHSLLDLLGQLSPSFQPSFQKVIEMNNSKEPLAVVQIANTIPASPWAVPLATAPSVAHHNDIARTQENYLVAGIENAETLRDWNEEFQTTKELPKDTVQDRVFRERLTSKLFADFNDAAARGAVLVAKGEIAPLNPTEARDAQIFVYNNIFFSFGADGVSTFASEGGDEAARVATGKDASGVQIVNQLDFDGLYTAGTVVVDYLGKRIVAQSIVPGIFKQREPEENQIDYGAVDGRNVIASDERFVPAFEKLSKALRVKKHGVWDTAGKRHELQGSVETKGLLGTDGRRYVLDLYRITPLDILWMEEHGKARQPAPASQNSVKDGGRPAYPHRMTMLRPELVEAYWKLQLREWADDQVKNAKSNGTSKAQNQIDDSASTATDSATDGTLADKSELQKTPSNEIAQLDEHAKQRINISDFHFALNPDVYSGPEPQNPEEQADWAQDEEEVRAVCEHLRSKVIQELVSELGDGEISFPMDGQSLSRLLHKRGINIRYIGTLASLAEGKKLEALKVLLLQSMITRSFKHVAAAYLRAVPAPLATACIAHLLNCLLGTGITQSPTTLIDQTLASMYPEADLSFQTVTASSMKKEIEDQIESRFRFTMHVDWMSEIKHLQLLRDICLSMGLQIQARDYVFSTPSTHAVEAGSDNQKDAAPNGQNKKKKKNRDGSPSSIKANGSATTTTFTPDDIVNIVPVIKEASPRSLLAEEALEAGRLSIIDNQHKIGQELLLESLTLHEQIYGMLHPEVARVYNSLSMLYYNLGEHDASIELARKAVVVAERTLGLDHAETLLNYLNLSLISHACGQTKQALLYVRHALDIWKIIYGPDHPDIVTTINNAAVMLQNLKEYHTSRIWFEASLAVCSELYGRSSVNAATLLFQLAQALALDSDSKAAVLHMRESYNVFLAELGPEDKNTKEAEKWLEQLTTNAVSIARHAKDVAARGGKLKVLGRTLSLNPGQTDTVASSRAATAPSASSNRNAVGEMDKRSIDELLRYIEGTDQKNSTPSKKRGARSNNPKRRGGSTVATK